MTNLLNNLNTILTAGVGGITFLGAWTYAVLRWLASIGPWDVDWVGPGGLAEWWF